MTGGTSGIGHGTATLFRDAGADVTITGTRSSEAGEYDTDLTGMQYRQLRLDDPAAIDEFAASFATLDVLVNNAGANFPGGLDEKKPDGFEASVALNPDRTVPAHGRPAPGAARVHGGRRGQRRQPRVDVGAARGSHGPGLRLGQGRHRQHDAQPGRRLGPAQHPRQRGGPGAIGNTDDPADDGIPRSATRRSRIPAGRFGLVGEVAPTIAFLCTEQSSYTSGALFIVDGASDCY